MTRLNYSRKRILRKKVCPICKRTFNSYYSFQIYCDICKKLNSFQHKKKLGLWKPKEPTIKTCKFCGEQFKGKSKQQYCCHDHAVKAYRYISFKIYKKIGKRVCKKCGKEFTTTNKNRNKIFCSINCCKSFHSHKQYISKQRKAPKRGSIKTCKYCGKKYTISKERQGEYFCSVKCYYRFIKIPAKCKSCGEPIKSKRVTVKSSNYCDLCKEIYLSY